MVSLLSLMVCVYLVVRLVSSKNIVIVRFFIRLKIVILDEVICGWGNFLYIFDKGVWRLCVKRYVSSGVKVVVYFIFWEVLKW